MIIFIGPNRQRGNVKRLRLHPKAPPYKFRSYNWLYRTFKLPSATYVFTGIDRLDFNERRLAGKIYRHIKDAGEGFLALNDPAHAMGRYALLKSLHAAGINKFDVYLGSSQPKPTNFPVFIRRNSTSTMPLTDLIQTQPELDEVLQRLCDFGEPLDDLIVIEFCAEPVSDGVYRKYSSYFAAGKTVLNWSAFEKRWMVKDTIMGIVADQVYLDEYSIVEQNAFAEEVKTVFTIAGIEYGRVDFGVVSGRPQFYEINFNSNFQTISPSSVIGARKKTVELVLDRHIANLAALSSSSGCAINNIVDPEITAFRLRPWRNYAPQRY